MHEPSYPGLPRWVKMFAAGAIVVLVLLVALRTGGLGAEHGPGRHIAPVASHQAPPTGSDVPAEEQHDQSRGDH